MKKLLIVITLNFALSTFHCFCFAQNKYLDSLLTLLKTDKADTNKVIHLSRLSSEYESIGYFENGLNYGTAALTLANKLNFKKGVILAYNSIGNIYRSQASYPKALDCFLKALKLAEEFGDKKKIAEQLLAIGAMYSDQGEHFKALDYYSKAMKVAEQINYRRMITIILGNSALAYLNLNDLPKALEYSRKALSMEEEFGDKENIASLLGTIAGVYDAQHNYHLALDYLLRALKIEESRGNKNGTAIWLNQIGVLYTETRKLKKAEQYIKKAIVLEESIGALELIMNDEGSLSALYEKAGQPKLALIHYKKAIALKDTLFSQENKKQLVRKEMQYDFDKKEIAAKAEQDKRDAVTAAEKKKQQYILLLVSCFLLLVFVFAGFIFRSLRITRKQNQIIELQNTKTEHQKKVIEEKHKEITDSINYAERIQRSFLASKDVLDVNLSSGGYFVFFQPKDVVSGDFYWAGKLANGNFALVTADSTGHGVPGAIMSILNISSLEKAVEQGLWNPSEIFWQTRKTIIERLKKDGSAEGGKDGMDASIICFDFANQKFTYSAANNPVWVVRENNLIELKPDKMPVGKHDKDQTPYTQTEFQLQKGDVVYTLTDGLPDQFGGPKGKKFMSKQLKEFLVSISHLPMDEQKQKLNDVFESWKGNFEQVDDVSLIGVRI